MAGNKGVRRRLRSSADFKAAWSAWCVGGSRSDRHQPGAEAGQRQAAAHQAALLVRAWAWAAV